MRLAVLASLTGHAAALAALAVIDWRATEQPPSIPIAVLVAPALGDQASPPSPSAAAPPPPPPPAASAPATASSAPSLDLASALADLPPPTEVPPTKPTPAPTPTLATPKPTRHAAKPTTAAPSAVTSEEGKPDSTSVAPSRGSEIASTESATAPVVEHGPSVLPGNPRPAYPPAARRRSLEGRAIVRATVTAEGQVASVELRQSSSHESLDQAALEAVRRWKFAPARRGELAIAGAVDLPVVFRLED
jgi:periplasmic protein TonB